MEAALAQKNAPTRATQLVQSRHHSSFKATCFTTELIPWPKSAEGEDKDLVIVVDVDAHRVWRTAAGFRTRARVNLDVNVPLSEQLAIARNLLALKRAIHASPVNSQPGVSSWLVTARWVLRAQKNLQKQGLWV
ncbi:MAG: hypothetical protein M1829_000329 [Trizodia sp. TS-e1964]|nr:MAG: hypothetical protein M1829_000329 [Trizodia sp. TS-e1964]